MKCDDFRSIYNSIIIIIQWYFPVYLVICVLTAPAHAWIQGSDPVLMRSILLLVWWSWSDSDVDAGQEGGWDGTAGEEERWAGGWTAMVGSIGMVGVLSELRWGGCYNNNYYLVYVWWWCMVWWGVSAVSGSSGRDEIPCSLMKSHDMKSNVASGGSNERMLSDSKRQIPRITARESQENLLMKKSVWLAWGSNPWPLH